MSDKKSILFCGKHRVNFAMFEPVYQKLRGDSRVELFLSTGRYRLKPILGWRNPRNAEIQNEHVFTEFKIDPAHIIKTSHNDKKPYDVYVTSNVDSRMQPPNSRASVQIFHGVSFRNFAVRGDYLRFTKLFFAGRYHIEQYIRQGLLKEGDPRIVLMGMPKLDCVVDGSITREEVLGGLGLDPATPTVLWCPTGARYNSFEKLGAAALKAVQELGVNLIVKLHDHPHLPTGVTQKDYDAEVRSNLGAKGRLATHSNVAPLLVAADALISDASSVAYEFCLRDRPIIFVDVPELLAERAAMSTNAMDENTHGRRMGRIVKTTAELKEAIAHALAHPGELSAERRAAAAHLFHEPGTATARCAKALMELAGIPAAAPRLSADSIKAQSMVHP